MMQYSRIDGTEMVLRRFDRITKAAEEQLGVELGIIGRDLRDIQRADVPEDTGALKSRLSVELVLDQLRVRVGLIGLFKSSASTKRIYGDAFYGRFVQFGVKAQTITVRRKRNISTKSKPGQQLLRERKWRRGKAVEKLVKTYSYAMPARKAQPFIFVPKAQEYAAQRLADFWDQTLSKAGA